MAIHCLMFGRGRAASAPPPGSCGPASGTGSLGAGGNSGGGSVLDSTALGGACGGTVVLLDLDARFDIVKMFKVGLNVWGSTCNRLNYFLVGWICLTDHPLLPSPFCLLRC